MITIRPSYDRGVANLGWLDSRHSFSFGNYVDPNHMGFAMLRVINEDKIQPRRGFPTHGHRDMEIITYVLEGELEHKDSLGNGSIIRPGDVQRMSAGTGILHSEFNASETHPVHLLQIWLLTAQNEISPSYEQIHIELRKQPGELCLIGSQEGQNGSVTIHQDVNLYAASLAEHDAVAHPIAEERVIWVQVVRGAIKLNGHLLEVGDGAAIARETNITLIGASDMAEVLVFDMAE